MFYSPALTACLHDLARQVPQLKKNIEGTCNHRIFQNKIKYAKYHQLYQPDVSWHWRQIYQSLILKLQMAFWQCCPWSWCKSLHVIQGHQEVPRLHSLHQVIWRVFLYCVDTLHAHTVVVSKLHVHVVWNSHWTGVWPSLLMFYLTMNFHLLFVSLFAQRRLWCFLFPTCTCIQIARCIFRTCS